LKDFSLGCNRRSTQHIPGNPPSIDEQFRMVKACGLYEHYDAVPQPGQEAEYLRAVEKHDFPMRTGLWTYAKGRDDALLPKNLQLQKDARGECHNIMLFDRHADGHRLSDDEVVEFYLRAYEIGEKLGIQIAFEVHIYMWSEDLRRVSVVADKVQARGATFNFVLDHSHVLLKLDNPEEQALCGIREDVETGKLLLDPYEPGNLVDGWIARNMTVWAQVRPVAPRGPKNVMARHPDGRIGRACQYPFVRPKPGEFHDEWHAYRLEPSKEVVRKVLRHHRDNAASRLRYMTTEYIDLPDYGEGCRYSLFEQSLALAAWIRSTWEQIKREAPA
jgi:hypothetical protein